MELLSVGFKSNWDDIKSLLDNEFSSLSEDFYIKKYSKTIDNTLFVKYSYKNSDYKNNREYIINRFSRILSSIIIDYYQNNIINKLVNNMCYYLDVEEKSKVKERAKELLVESDRFVEKNMYYESDKYKVYNMLVDYLKYNNEIILEGFINFRLRFLVSKIEEIIDKLLSEILLEKEYNEFIKILQYFVEIQEPKIRLVNVVIKKNNKYLLYDENKNLINNEFLEEIVDEMSDSDMNYSDLLISSLITIAPREVVLHIDEDLENKDIIQIIENVFVNKVKVCSQCEFCSDKKEMINRIENK